MPLLRRRDEPAGTRCQMREKLFAIGDDFWIEAGELSAKGNIVDHEYEIERDGHKIAEISKRWFRVRDTYGIEIVPGENDALILAATVCIDEMAGRQPLSCHLDRGLP